MLLADPTSRETRVREALEAAGGPGLRIVLVLVLALLLRRVLHRGVDRLVARTLAGLPSALRPLRERAPSTAVDASPLASERRRQRAETLGSVLRSAVSVFVLGTAAGTVLGELGIDLRPVLASAGIVGVAVGFGAQNLVRDFLNGLFMLLEDQYGVGDVIDAGPAEGVVEGVGLRSTRLRSADGTVWHIRNGEILRVGNRTQGTSRALVDVPVPKELGVDRSTELVRAAAASLRADEQWRDAVLDDGEVLGLESLGDAPVLRVGVATATGERERVARELRRRVAAALADPPPARRPRKASS